MIAIGNTVEIEEDSHENSRKYPQFGPIPKVSLKEQAIEGRGGLSMQVTHDFDTAAALPVGFGVRVLLLSANEKSDLERRISGLGGSVEVETETFAALAAIIDDPMGYGLFVMECDDLGGAEAGQRAAKALFAVQSRVPVVLISKSYAAQVFPQERAEPVCLRAPISNVSLRVGFEHALRDRLIWRAA